MLLAFHQQRQVVLDAVVGKSDVLEEACLVFAELSCIAVLTDGLLEKFVLWTFALLSHWEEDDLCNPSASFERRECKADRRFFVQFHLGGCDYAPDEVLGQGIFVFKAEFLA